MVESYSVQAENLITSLVSDYKESLSKFDIDSITLEKIRKLKFKINDKYRRVLDLAELKNNKGQKEFKLLVFNSEYKKVIMEELESIGLESTSNDQFINIKKPPIKYNELMELVDQIEKAKINILTKCSKAKLEPTLRARHGLENDFIDLKTSRETSFNCQKIFEEKEKMINEITLYKIQNILGKKLFSKFKEESLKY